MSFRRGLFIARLVLMATLLILAFADVGPVVGTLLVILAITSEVLGASIARVAKTNALLVAIVGKLPPPDSWTVPRCGFEWEAEDGTAECQRPPHPRGPIHGTHIDTRPNGTSVTRRDDLH